MKPILPYSILLSIAISPLALAASYTGGQILNKTVTYDGIVKVTASTNIATNWTGAVEVAANGVNTTLQGNVTVTNTGNGGSGLYLYAGSGAASSINVNNVTSDVNITTNGIGSGRGVWHYGDGTSNASKLTIDAGSNYDLYISKTGTKTGDGNGVRSEAGGKIDISAKNVNIDYTSTGQSTGVRSYGANSIINITAEKVTAKAGYRGVDAYYGGVLNITGDLDTVTSRADGTGVSAWGGGYATTAVTVSGHTTVSGKAQYGVYADTKGTVTLKGGLTVNQATLGATAAVYAYGATIKDDIANGTGGTKYDISGLLKAQTNSGTVGTINLHMGADSTFTGYTSEVAAADVINLELSNGAQWTNTAASTMSNLNLLVNSTIVFNEIGTSDAFYNINSAAVMLAEGSLLKVDLADTFTGDVKLFGSIANTDTWNGGTDVENAILLNADGTKQFIYTNPSAGVFRITGIVLVPEPTTASLTLLGLTALMMRRRRVTA